MPETEKLRIPSYRRHRPSGQAVVTIERKDHYLGPWRSRESKLAYERLISEWLANGRCLPRGNFQSAQSDVTIAELVLKYVQFAESYYAKGGQPTKELDRIKSAVKPLNRLYSSELARDFGPLALKAVREVFVSSGISRGVVNSYVDRIKRMFKWATANEMVAVTVFQSLQTVDGLRKGRCQARETDPVRPVPDSMVDPIRPHVARQVWAIIELMRLTGARCGEIVQMRGIDLDVSGSVWLYRPSTHKAQHHGHDRVVEIGPRAQEVIKPFLKADLSAYLFSPADALAEHNAKRRDERVTPMTPSQRRRRPKRHPARKPGGRYTTESLRRAIARACDQAFPHPELSKIEPDELTPEQQTELARWQKEHRWHPHQLRHSFATRIRKEYGIETARVLLGHRSAVTSELYAEIDRQKVAEIIARVG
ncbi:MAG TPA: site-specific integrase [Planctomycetota bacterium]|nr:site-specific integrase [Planctomycetota bacterium]